MPDPRFDGSLDAPTFIDRGGCSECGLSESHWNHHDANENGHLFTDVDLAPLVSVEVNAPTAACEQPVPPAPPNEPEVIAAVPVAPIRATTVANRRAIIEWGARNDTIIVPDGCAMAVLTTSLSPADALVRAKEALDGEDEDLAHVAAVMLSELSVSPEILFPDDPERTTQIRARLERDWIRMPADETHSFLRAGWLEKGEALSFILDALVANGDARRTWAGLYRGVIPEEEPWRDRPLREAIEILLSVTSGIVYALALQLAASNVKSAFASNVTGVLYQMEKQGKAKRTATPWGMMWSAAC
jgi:hypothetical protein